MRIKLYSNESENNRLEKTITLVAETSASVNMRDFNFENPVLKLGLVGLSKRDKHKINYAILYDSNGDEIARYFVSSIESIVDELYYLELHIDVLSTYKNEILESIATAIYGEGYSPNFSGVNFPTYETRERTITNFDDVFSHSGVLMIVVNNGGNNT